MDAKAAWLMVVVAVALVGGAVGAVQMSSMSTRLEEARNDTADAEDDAEDAEQEIEELEDDLGAARRRLAQLRREQRETQQALTLHEALAAGTAVAVRGLSADVSDFDCFDRRCSSIEGTATFSNETQLGSSVTCVFKVEYQDGETSHFTSGTEYVEARDTTVSGVFFSTTYESPIDFWYDSKKCYRGLASLNIGFGD